jgi:regulator of RNase E activity RraB
VLQGVGLLSDGVVYVDENSRAEVWETAASWLRSRIWTSESSTVDTPMVLRLLVVAVTVVTTAVLVKDTVERRTVEIVDVLVDSVTIVDWLVGRTYVVAMTDWVTVLTRLEYNTSVDVPAGTIKVDTDSTVEASPMVVVDAGIVSMLVASTVEVAGTTDSAVTVLVDTIETPTDATDVSVAVSMDVKLVIVEEIVSFKDTEAVVLLTLAIVLSIDWEVVVEFEVVDIIGAWLYCEITSVALVCNEDEITVATVFDVPARLTIDGAATELDELEDEWVLSRVVAVEGNPPVDGELELTIDWSFDEVWDDNEFIEVLFFDSFDIGDEVVLALLRLLLVDALADGVDPESLVEIKVLLESSDLDFDDDESLVVFKLVIEVVERDWDEEADEVWVRLLVVAFDVVERLEEGAEFDDFGFDVVDEGFDDLDAADEEFPEEPKTEDEDFLVEELGFEDWDALLVELLFLAEVFAVEVLDLDVEE